MRHIFAALSRKSGTRETPASQSKDTPALHDQGLFIAAKPFSSASVADPSAGQPAGLDTNVLPPDYEVEALLLAYFSNMGLLFPYVHKQTFMDTYQDLKSQGFSTSVRRTWLGLLNMILAMATSTASQDSVSSPSRRTSSDVFYRRAQKLCRNQMLRGTTLETAQYLLIITQYLQGTQNSLQTWTIHGLAVKAAFSIGLHSSDILKRFMPLEQEIRKRTWHGCILLDSSYLRYLMRLVDGWIPAPPTDQANASSTLNVIDDALRVVYGRGARTLQGDAMPVTANDGLDDLEHGPLFMNEMQQWFEAPSWYV
ncbi:hypothetical protein FOBRF1_014679 [Fusarium oxysporum]